MKYIYITYDFVSIFKFINIFRLFGRLFDFFQSSVKLYGSVYIENFTADNAVSP